MSHNPTLSIAVLAGGYSGEFVISLKSAATVMENIDRNEFSPLLVRIFKENWWVESEGESYDIDKKDFSWIDHSGTKNTFDSVFIMVHGTPGEDGILQQYFEKLKLPFTTGSTESVSGTFNKYYTTERLRKAGYTVADAVKIDKSENLSSVDYEKIGKKVSFPCFVKPNEGGSSLGISRVERQEDLLEAIEFAFSTECTSVLVEAFLEGREFSMGIVPGVNLSPMAMPITEIITKNLFFDFEAKYEGASREITPADLSDSVRIRMESIGIQVYQQLDCKGMVRIDYILVEGGEAAILEINSVPGFSKVSLLPQQLAEAGISIEEMITRVIKSASV
jgi:D-alanine-D-alanine ligase|tara:strand:- start:1061 stop:2065 length:1005 start_codon:yes stop_codon:yes gene_type:complete